MVSVAQRMISSFFIYRLCFALRKSNFKNLKYENQVLPRVQSKLSSAKLQIHARKIINKEMTTMTSVLLSIRVHRWMKSHKILENKTMSKLNLSIKASTLHEETGSFCYTYTNKQKYIFYTLNWPCVAFCKREFGAAYARDINTLTYILKHIFHISQNYIFVYNT